MSQITHLPEIFKRRQPDVHRCPAEGESVDVHRCVLDVLSVAEALNLMISSRTLKVSSRPRAADTRQMGPMVEELAACQAFLLRVISSPSLPLLALLSELRLELQTLSVLHQVAQFLPGILLGPCRMQLLPVGVWGESYVRVWVSSGLRL